MAKPKRRPGESLIEWLWRCEAARCADMAPMDDQITAAQRQIDADYAWIQAAIDQHDAIAQRAAWGRLGWETRPKAREADRIRAHGLGVQL